MALMAEGVDVSALERVFEIKEGTLRTWLTRAGMQAAKVHRHFFLDLILHHIQLDELPGTECLWQCGPMCVREARKCGYEQ